MKFPTTAVTSIAFALLAAPVLSATSLHTWVSGTGSDANTGTRISPYATFATAIANTTAGGIVSAVDSGDFGAITILKAITIDGGSSGATISFTSSEAIYIGAGPTDTVILRHLTITGLGAGPDAIFLSSGQNLIIEDCIVENFTDIGLGIGSSAAANVVVKNTVITGGSLGLRVYQGPGPNRISLRGVTISGASSVAVFVRSGLMEISDSLITMSNIALEVDTNATISVANSVLSYNGTDSLPFSPSTILLSNNNTWFANNGTGGGGGTALRVNTGPVAAGFRIAAPAVVPDDVPRPRRQ